MKMLAGEIFRGRGGGGGTRSRLRGRGHCGPRGGLVLADGGWKEAREWEGEGNVMNVVSKAIVFFNIGEEGGQHRGRVDATNLLAGFGCCELGRIGKDGANLFCSTVGRDYRLSAVG